MATDKPGLVDPVAQLLADHYQKTYELTYGLWGQRNRIFLLLLGSIAAATLLTFNPLETRPLLLDWIAKNLGVTEPARINQLRQTFPFGILQGIILLGIFYLVVNLYHRSLYVLRIYETRTGVNFFFY